MLLAEVGEAAASTTCSFQSVGSTMKLLRDCTTDSSIVVPDGVTLDGRGRTITAVDPSGGHFLGAVVRNGGPVASVKNLRIVGSGLSDVCDSGNDALRGIQLVDARGWIVDNTVTGLHQGSSSGCSEGNGIVATASPQDGSHPATKSVVIVGNRIVDAQQLGITVLGDVSATIAGNRVTGGVGNPPLRAGINIGNGALGSIFLNAVTHPVGTPDSVGVRVGASSGVLVSGNALSGSKEGIFVTSACATGPHANRNRILFNVVRVLSEGIDLVARTTSTSLCDPHVDQNVVAGNLIELTTATGVPTSGVFVGAQDFDPRDPGGFHAPVADGNVIKGNVIKHFGIGVYQNGFDTGTVVRGNVVVP
jgi:hypothetical protein